MPNRLIVIHNAFPHTTLHTIQHYTSYYTHGATFDFNIIHVYQSFCIVVVYNELSSGIATLLSAAVDCVCLGKVDSRYEKAALQLYIHELYVYNIVI